MATWHPGKLQPEVSWSLESNFNVDQISPKKNTFLRHKICKKKIGDGTNCSFDCFAPLRNHRFFFRGDDKKSSPVFFVKTSPLMLPETPPWPIGAMATGIKTILRHTNVSLKTRGIWMPYFFQQKSNSGHSDVGGHYITNPNKARIFRGNPSKHPYIWIVWFPPTWVI